MPAGQQPDDVDVLVVLRIPGQSVVSPGHLQPQGERQHSCMQWSGQVRSGQVKTEQVQVRSGQVKTEQVQVRSGSVQGKVVVL